VRLLSVIVNWRTADMTTRAVEALLRETEGLDAKAIVVDNDSGDGSYEKLCAAVEANGWSDRVEIVAAAKNGGYGYGNNVGFRIGLAAASPPDYFYVLNSDAFPDPGSIHSMLAFMDAHPKVGIAGNYVHGTDGRPHETAFRFPSAAGELESYARTKVFTKLFQDRVVAIGFPKQATRVDWVSGASMMLRREVLEDIGLFDETYFLYFEETDLCIRAHRAGWETWYLPESSVAHVGSVSTGYQDLEKRTPRYWFDSRRYYYLKNGGPAEFWKANAGFVFGSAVWRLRRLVQQKPRQDARGILRDLIKHTAGLE
jgi:N-acetylglucosaminyl-diphospho-decaprenol L-rhamnosyltransferase